MKKVDIEEIEPSHVRQTRRPLSAALETTDVAISYYTLPPGGIFSGSFHTHYDQEEVFIVLEGTATFEVEDGEMTVEAGEAVRFDRGDFQRGYNVGPDPVTAIVLGAPGAHHDLSQSKAKLQCSTCGERTVHDVELQEGADDYTRSCQDCGTINLPTPPAGLD